MKTTIGLLLASCACLAAPAYADAPAQSDASVNQGDIVVTAQKRETKMQDTAIVVSVVSGAEIQKDARDKLDDILVNTPGIEVQGVARGLVVNIRGLGLNLPPQNGAGAIATNYDGAYNARGEAASTGFYDLERVETLSGPQSTIYGRNAVGGVVNIISKDPVLGKFEGYAQGEVGSYNDARAEGALNLPLGDSLALRVSGAGVTRDGYLSNGHDDNKASSARAKLLFKPNDAVSVLVGYEQTTLGGQGPGAIPDASYAAGSLYTTDPSEGFQHHIAHKYWAELKADIGPGQLFVEPSYQTLHGQVEGSFGGNFAYDYDPLYTNQFALEARYSSKAGSKVAWDLGYYHYRDNSAGPTDIDGACFAASQGVVYIPAPGYSNTPAGPPGTPCVTTAYQTDIGSEVSITNVNSAFGQAVIPLVANLRLTLGGRESWVTTGGTDDLNADNTCGSGPSAGCPSPAGTPLTTPDIQPMPTVHTSYFDYRVSLEDKLSSATLLYGTIASGHREGGYGFSNYPYAPQPYAPESMVDYEAGIKNTLMGGALLLNADVFYYDYKSYQLVYVTFIGGNFAANFDTFPGHELGAEAYAAYAFTHSDKLTASLVYLDSKLTGSSAYAGEQFTFAPHRTFKVEYAHDFDLGGNGKLTAKADFRSLSSQLVTANDVTANISAGDMQKAYSTGDLFLGWTSPDKRYALTGYVKNVANTLIKSSEYFGYGQVQAPRTYGATLKVSF